MKKIVIFLLFLSLFISLITNCSNDVSEKQLATKDNHSLSHNNEENEIIKSYKIIYKNIEDAINEENPVTYSAGTKIDIIPPQHKPSEGNIYKFDDWYLNPQFSGEKITELNDNVVKQVQASAQGQIKDITLYAKWIGKDKQSVKIGNITYSGYTYTMSDNDLGIFVSNDLLWPENRIEDEKITAFYNMMYSNGSNKPEFSKHFFENDIGKDSELKNLMKTQGFKILYGTVFSDSYLIIHKYNETDKLETFCLYLKEPHNNPEVTIKSKEDYAKIQY